MINKRIRNDERPIFPKKAIITGGMPYGNKELHFGHVGGMFVHADAFARFLRDRIGYDNVIFVSGTDCYGSPIVEAYRKKCENEGYTGTIREYVEINNKKQKEVLDKYEISPNLYGASALGKTGEVHNDISAYVFNTLYKNGHLTKLSTPQFYDTERKCFINGRQVVGKCPIEGCQSEKAYADECDLGHQYSPDELIDPISTLSGKKPELRPVINWYFTLEDYLPTLQERTEFLAKNTNTRKFEIKALEEFLKDPCIYVQRKQIADLDALINELPEHEIVNEEKKPSITFIFKTLKLRDEAKAVLDSHDIHYRTGKTLVPFRLSGNIEWGVPVPEVEGEKDLTFWVWPESLWAPISFTKTYLMNKGLPEDEWKKWWEDDDTIVYQFIGQDNIYFYGLAEMGIFMGLKHKKGEKIDVEKEILPHIVANNHILFMDKKASSSSAVKPPMAGDLLEFYSPEQLRMHFLSLGLGNASVGFNPQVYLPEEEKKNAGPDPVLKDGNLLTNVYNRLLRSCFYTTQEYYDGVLPVGEVDPKIKEICDKSILEYERFMYNHEFHRVTYVLDSIIREINKHYVNNIKIAEKNNDDILRKQILVDCFHGIRVINSLLHPIAPAGTELVQDYLRVDDKMFNWEYIFDDIYGLVANKDNHRLKFLEPRFDFFKKPECQFRKDEE
ncbi:MAG: class I tRNA ligase family protein [Lachnospiraceae bacterium]|nr:class I tRNA ligase family protein [Lachnospiraceae bacterium]